MSRTVYMIVWACLCVAVLVLSGCIGDAKIEPKYSNNPTGVSGKFSKEAELAFAKAHVLWRNGVCEDPASASKFLKKALELEPEYGEAWLRRGRLLIQFAEYNAAVEDLDKAVRYYPASMSYAYRGYAEFGLGNYMGAEKNYTVALQKDSENATAWNFKGELLLARLQVDEGCEALELGAELGEKAPYENALETGICVE